MSRWADRAVRLAARTLPLTIRDRYREEWRADVAAAPEAGVRPASIAVGALVFAATLDRDVPSIAGFPTPAVAQRRARWALAFVASAAIVALARYLPGLESIWLPLTIALVVVSVIQLWAAARLSSGVARASAILATGSLAIFVAGSTIPVFISDAVPGSQYFLPLAMLLLLAALVLGVVAWGQLALNPGRIALLTVAGVVVFAVAWFQYPAAFPVASLCVAIGVAVTAGQRVGVRASRLTVIGTSAVLLALIAFCGLESLVLLPQQLFPGNSLAEVYAALPDAENGVRDVAVGGLVSAVCVVAYLIFCFTRGADRRRALLTAAALVAMIIFSSGYAGESLLTALVNSLPRVPLDAAPYGIGIGAVAYLALLVAVVGWVAPLGKAQPAGTAPGTGSP